MRRSARLVSRARSFGYRPIMTYNLNSFHFHKKSSFKTTSFTSYDFRKQASFFNHQKRSYSTDVEYETITLPSLSPTMEKGTLVDWVKKVGDKINPGEALANVQTDKATLEMEYPEEGYLAKILVPGGTEDLVVGAPIAIVVANEEDIEKVKDVEVSQSPSPKSESKPEPEPEKPKEEEKPSQTKSEQPKSLESETASESQPSGSSDRVKASPYAKKLANEMNIDLSNVSGTGPGGRIVAADVQEYTPKQSAKQTSTAAPVQGGTFEDIPVSQIRGIIANRLLESKQTIPHYYLTIECQMDELMNVRKQLNATGEKKGFKLSVNDFIIKAASLALKKVPEVNSSWQNTFIRQYHNVDVSVAVQTPSGLITPIVTDADKRGLESISNRVKELAGKAKKGGLSPQEFQGGTFTISNLGMFGVTSFSAIINPPQACILAVGTAQKKVIEASPGNFKTVTVMSVTLSCDHRVVDGAVGAQWLQAFKENMENPLFLML